MISPADLLPDWKDGRVKQAVLARAMRFRAESGRLFTEGSYVPLRVDGERADNVMAFARVHEGRASITVVTRLPGHLPGIGPIPVADAAVWSGTFIVTPRNFVGRRTVDVMAPEKTEGKEDDGTLAAC